MPYDGKLAQQACATLAPKLLAQLQKPNTPPETVIETLSILTILVGRFPSYLADIQPSPVITFIPLLTHTRPAVRKRAVLALAQFLPSTSSEAFSSLVTSTVQPALAPNAQLEHQRTIVQLIGAIARYAPQQLTPFLNVVVPAVLSLASRDDADSREGILQVCDLGPAYPLTY